MCAVNYNTFISNLEAKGLQTTALYGSEETNFQQYGEALSDELKQEILQSFDNEQDYILQEKVSQLFQSTNVVDSGSFISACQNLGLSCSVEYQSTSYIVDYKSSQSGAVVNGAIAVYTISDGQGGEIKIADANGNGYLESEELFMNEILGDINNGITASGTTGSMTDANAPAVKQISQEEFNVKVEEYLKLGFKKAEAESLANMALGTTNGLYTGTYERVTQDEFNQTVENYLRKGYSLKDANLFAQATLNVDDKIYTGGNEEKIKQELKKAEAAKEEEKSAEESSETKKGKVFISLTTEKDEDEEAA